jgi:MFS family permease
MNGAGGLESWRWLFILEGVPSIICDIAIFFFLPQYPETASWLNEEEKKLQTSRMGINCSHDSEKLKWEDAKHILKDLRLWVHYITYLALGVGVFHITLLTNNCPRAAIQKSRGATIYRSAVCLCICGYLRSSYDLRPL